MPRYQLRRPSPVRVFPRQVRRQVPTASTAPTAGVEVEDGPESPDSPGSESESEDEGEEPPSPAESGAPVTATGAPSAALTTASSPPSLTAVTTPQDTNAALPQITGAGSTTDSTTRPSLTSTILLETGQIPRPERPAPTSSNLSPRPQPETAGGGGNAPQRAIPQPQPLMTKGAVVAATILSVLGAVALIIGAVILFKRRKRKQTTYNQQLGEDAFNYSNPGYPRAPETAHVDPGLSFLNFRRSANDDDNNNNNDNSHMTRSTERSNTLFGPGPYSRPETVSTDRNNASRVPATPNPFADPPLSKAYDVLAGRPRSTTLTDRGSWIKNPFRDPESERFDPFGELQEKARRERARYMEEVRREAEVMRVSEEREKEFAIKDRMGLTPDGLPTRKGSGVTVDGLGVLDRSGGGAYR